MGTPFSRFPFVLEIDFSFVALQIGIGNLFALISSNGTSPRVQSQAPRADFREQSTERKTLLATLSDTERSSGRSDSDSSALLSTPTSSTRRT